jgi:hypothetical protein
MGNDQGSVEIGCLLLSLYRFVALNTKKFDSDIYIYFIILYELEDNKILSYIQSADNECANTIIYWKVVM